MTNWDAAIERYKREQRAFVTRQARNRGTWLDRLRRAHARGLCIRGCVYPDHPTVERSDFERPC
jgi:hypothetical protein